MAGSRTFNGTSDNIALASSASLSGITTEISLAAWVYLTDTLGGDDIIWSFSTVAVPDFTAYLQINTGGNGALSGGIAVNSPNASSTGTTAILLNVWTHVAMTYNQLTDQLVHLYVNGVEDTYVFQSQGGATIEPFTGTTVAIGTDNEGDFFAGRLSEARIYNTALTTPQVAAVAADTTGNPNAGGVGASLVAYLHLCGVTSPEPDASGNGNVGNLTGTTAGTASPGYGGCSTSPVSPGVAEFVLPFSKRTTAIIAVFSCIFVASPMQGARLFTSDVPTIAALQLSYAQLLREYHILRHQDVANQKSVLDAVINQAVTTVTSLNATVESIMAASNNPNAAQLAVMQTVVANALTSLLKVQVDE